MALFATSLLGNFKAFRGGDAPPHECADRRSSLRRQKSNDDLSLEFSDPAAVTGITPALIGEPSLLPKPPDIAPLFPEAGANYQASAADGSTCLIGGGD